MQKFMSITIFFKKIIKFGALLPVSTSKSLYKSKKFTPESSCFERFFLVFFQILATPFFEEFLHPSAKILPLNPCINQKNSLQKVAVLEGVFSNSGNPLFWRIFAPFCQNFTSKSLYKSKKFTPESSCFEKFKI